MAQQSRYTENNPATTAGFFDQVHFTSNIKRKYIMFFFNFFFYID